MGRKLIVDLETNGLYHEVTRVHLFLMKDIDTEEVFVFREHQAQEALRMLRDAELLVFQNGVNYDLPVLEKLYPGFQTDALIRDTLIISRLMFSNIKDACDYDLFRKGLLPGKCIGGFSLEAWGYRLGIHKGDYGKNASDDDEDVWAEWSPEMEAYGIQDLHVTHALWNHICEQIERQNYSQEAIRFEHRFADLISRMEKNGFVFDEAKAKVLYQELAAKRDELTTELKKLFKPWYKPAKWKTVEGTNKKSGKKFKKPANPWGEDSAETETPGKTLTYKDPLKASRVAGAPFCPVELKEFNPGSRDMIADRLQRMFGWVPKEFTDTEKPKVSEDILRDLVGELDEEEDGIEETEEELYDKFVTAIPQAKSLADFFLIQKRIGQLAEGKNGWLKLVRDGKIHGSVNTLGAVTRRVTHSRPNVSQTPAVRSPYGKEMRALWAVPKGWWMLGTDLSGIEIRCFAHTLAEFDGGEYGRLVIEDDIHTVNQKAFGVPTRDNAKTTLYATLYGAGFEKLGSIVGGNAEAGKRIKNNFMNAIPAYRLLTKKLQRMSDRQGWIPALDGGRLHVRSSHKALNTCLQSMGALVAKNWSMQLEEDLMDEGLEHGWNGDFVFNVFAHDELVVACRTQEIAQHVGARAKAAVKKTERHFHFQCPLDCEWKIGFTWGDVH